MKMTGSKRSGLKWLQLYIAFCMTMAFVATVTWDAQT